MRGRLILVVGMHRSGTSLIVQILHALGVYLGQEVERQPVPSNQSGHWEHTRVWRLHERLLEAFGQGWGGPIGPLPPRWLEWPETRAAALTLEAMVRQHVTRAGVWAVKDPRATRLLPLWTTVAQAARVDLRVVAGRRSADSVVQSLTVRDGFSTAQARRLWHYYEHELSAFSQIAPVTVIDYDELLTRGSETIMRLADVCGLSGSAEAVQKAEALIRHPLRHHHSPPNDKWGSQEVLDPVLPTSAQDPAFVMIFIETSWNEVFLIRSVKSVLAQSHTSWRLSLVADPSLHELIDRSLAPYGHLMTGRVSILSPGSETTEWPEPLGCVAMTEFDQLAPMFLETTITRLRQGGPAVVTTEAEWLVTQGVAGGWRVAERHPVVPGHEAGPVALPCLIGGAAAALARQVVEPIGIEQRLALLRAAASREPHAHVAEPLVARDVRGEAIPAGETYPCIELSEVVSWPVTDAQAAGAMPLLLLPGADMREMDDIFLSDGADPQVHLTSAAGVHLRQPAGLYVLRLGLELMSLQEQPRLYARSDGRFSEGQSVELTRPAAGSVAVLINAPKGLAGLRIDPSENVVSAARMTEPTLLRLSAPLVRLRPPRRTARFPDVLCIGAQKSATTWLHHHLLASPHVWSAPVKEFHHFDDQGRADAAKQSKALELLASAQTDGLRTFAVRLGFPTGRDWEAYLDLFADVPTDQRALDFTPAYATLGGAQVRDVASVLASVRVIFILRNPVDRSLSGAFHEARVRHIEPTPAALTALAREEANVARSDYLTTLDLWQRYIPPARMKILFYDDLVCDPTSFFQEACAFVGITPPVSGQTLVRPINAGEGDRTRPELDPLRAELAIRSLSQIQELAARYAHPCLRWQSAAQARIRSFVAAA